MRRRLQILRGCCRRNTPLFWNFRLKSRPSKHFYQATQKFLVCALCARPICNPWPSSWAPCRRVLMKAKLKEIMQIPPHGMNSDDESRVHPQRKQSRGFSCGGWTAAREQALQQCSAWCRTTLGAAAADTRRYAARCT